MNAPDWSGLDWGTAATLLPMGRASWDPDMDVGKAARGNFDTQANAALLASLSGNAADPLGYLASQGYSVGVGHEQGTSPGGRPEYWGLIDPSGKFVQGQTDPTMTMSDTMMDNVLPFLMMAGPSASAISTSAGLAGGAGAAAGAGAGAGTGTLGAAADGLTALGSSWSPQALGLTGGVVPGASAAEIAALSSSLPSVAPSITDLAIQGAMRGAVTGGIKGLATGQNPFESALQGAIGGGLTGGIGGGVNAINPGGAGWINAGLTGGITSAIGGGNPLIGAIGGAVGPLANSAMSSITQPLATTGGNMNLGGLGDWFTDWSPDQLNLTTDIGGNVISSDLPTFSGGGLWNPEYGNLVSDWAANQFSSDSGGSDVAGSALLNVLKSAIGSASGAVGGGGNLAALIGAGLGATQGGGTETSSRDPWSAAQPFLRNLLTDADAMRADLKQNPFTPQQTQAYQQAFSGLDQARTALPGLLSWGQNAMQRQSTTPSYEQLFGQAGPAYTPGGLLSAPQQPTAQAGGVGGLLGDNQRDRAKSLTVAGRGLIG